MRNESLSPTLIKVLKLMSQGLTNREIAFQLQKSVSTVNSQVSTILKITDCRNRVEACVYYLVCLK